jgi:hypothetical protein
MRCLCTVAERCGRKWCNTSVVSVAGCGCVPLTANEEYAASFFQNTDRLPFG